MEHFDVLIIGAGLSGIGAAYHLQTRCKDRSYLILEARDAIGGTWDLFRYPGVRSDSDMYTLGYSFAPWKEQKAIADGASILTYVREVASKNGIDRHIRYSQKVVKARWLSEQARWIVEARLSDTGETSLFSCNFLHMCSGYYDYSAGHMPELPGAENFSGRIVHPQFWPEGLDYRNKKVVVIGSGATAVTLVPAMAAEAAHVTMLQRSPTYIVSRPAEDRIANWLRKRLPSGLAYALARWKNVLLQMFFFTLARKKPEAVKANILKEVRKELGPGYESHFTPSYNPWDQRLCLVPDSDLFKAMRSGKASIVTAHIDHFTSTGIKLQSGEEVQADIVVTATGLKLQVLSDVELEVDGAKADLSKCLSYKGMMFSGIPNLSYTFGYTNASWTLKADLTSEYLCRLLNHMAKHGYSIAVPRREADVEERPFVDFTSGYVERARDILPKQGSRKPWRLHQNYALDLAALKFGKVEDGVMHFGKGT